MNEKREGWIKKVMEYDVQIRVVKIIQGKGFCEHIIVDMEKQQVAKSEDPEQHAEVTYQQSDIG
ncbi:hypothetical protein KI387_010704, partial [Taxus chinensis]